MFEVNVEGLRENSEGILKREISPAIVTRQILPKNRQVHSTLGFVEALSRNTFDSSQNVEPNHLSSPQKRRVLPHTYPPELFP